MIENQEAQAQVILGQEMIDLLHFQLPEPKYSFDSFFHSPNFFEQSDLFEGVDEQHPTEANEVKIKKRGLGSRKISSQSQCSICLSDLKKKSLVPDLECKHEFHKRCLRSWMKKQKTCPLCRMKINLPNQGEE